jgi:uncharacterized protein involved in exopolysaccharide biosynthesis
MRDQSRIADHDENEGAVDDGMSLLDLAVPLAEYLKLLVIGPLLVGLLALGITFIVPPTYTSKTVFLPPQQQQSAAAAALASLSALTGGGSASKSPAEQYVALMQSMAVQNRLIDQFRLMEVYDAKFREDAIRELNRNTRINIGKKDGLISVEVDDHDRQRAADMANASVEELRRLTNGLALSEAQQRRIFFEEQLRTVRDRLTEAQLALQSSGFDIGAIKAEPKAAAESYAALRAQATAVEIRLQSLQRSLVGNAPEVQQQQAALAALRAKIAQQEQNVEIKGGADYVSKYREFKYQETLFDLMAKQYEMARVDESNESSIIQVVDQAVPAERRSSPRRALTAVIATLATLLLMAGGLIARQSWQRSLEKPGNAEKLQRLRSALGRT